MKKNIWIIVLIIIVLSIVFWFMNKNIQYTAPIPSVPQQPTQPTTPTIVTPIVPVPVETIIKPITNTPISNTPVVSTPSKVSILINNFSFSPSNITVPKRTTITWTNNDSVSHTVTGDNGGPTSAYVNHGQSYNYTFNFPGSFPYHCSIHPSMHGEITVQ